MLLLPSLFRCGNWGTENLSSLLKVIQLVSVRAVLWIQAVLPQRLCSKPVVPNLFSTRDRFYGRQFFHGLGGDGFKMIQVHYIYCLLYFYYYYTVMYNEIITQLTIMLTGGRAQVVMQVMRSGCKYRWSFASSLASCSPPDVQPGS